jgi:hypothetical protein
MNLDLLANAAASAAAQEALAAGNHADFRGLLQGNANFHMSALDWSDEGTVGTVEKALFDEAAAAVGALPSERYIDQMLPITSFAVDRPPTSVHRHRAQDNVDRVCGLLIKHDAMRSLLSGDPHWIRRVWKRALCHVGWLSGTFLVVVDVFKDHADLVDAALLDRDVESHLLDEIAKRAPHTDEWYDLWCVLYAHRSNPMTFARNHQPRSFLVEAQQTARLRQIRPASPFAYRRFLYAFTVYYRFEEATALATLHKVLWDSNDTPFLGFDSSECLLALQSDPPPTDPLTRLFQPNPNQQSIYSKFISMLEAHAAAVAAASAEANAAAAVDEDVLVLRTPSAVFQRPVRVVPDAPLPQNWYTLYQNLDGIPLGAIVFNASLCLLVPDAPDAENVPVFLLCRVVTKTNRREQPKGFPPESRVGADRDVCGQTVPERFLGDDHFWNLWFDPSMDHKPYALTGYLDITNGGFRQAAGAVRIDTQDLWTNDARAVPGLAPYRCLMTDTEGYSLLEALVDPSDLSFEFVMRATTATESTHATKRNVVMIQRSDDNNNDRYLLSYTTSDYWYKDGIRGMRCDVDKTKRRRVERTTMQSQCKPSLLFPLDVSDDVVDRMRHGDADFPPLSFSTNFVSAGPDDVVYSVCHVKLSQAHAKGDVLRDVFRGLYGEYRHYVEYWGKSIKKDACFYELYFCVLMRCRIDDNGAFQSVELSDAFFPMRIGGYERFPYAFSLWFPMSLCVVNDQLLLSGGEGDTYPSVVSMSLPRLTGALGFHHLQDRVLRPRDYPLKYHAVYADGHQLNLFDLEDAGDQERLAGMLRVKLPSA